MAVRDLSPSAQSGPRLPESPGPDLRPHVATLLRVVERSARAGAPRVLVCTHDNPDPDAIASGYALGELLRHCTGAKTTLAHGGVLGRAENRAMVRLLKIPLVRFSRVEDELEDFDVLCLVDTQPHHKNHRLDEKTVGGKPLVCFDHHPVVDDEAEVGAVFADLGGDYGATSTKLTAYLDAAGVPLTPSLASALFYGIKSDTRDLGREVGAVDIWAYQRLIAETNMALLSQIEHPRLPRGYFACLGSAVRKARCYDNVVVCDLGQVYVPDLVAETADWLLLAEGIRWAIVTGEHENDVYASIRVSDRRFSAGKLVRDVIEDFPGGSAGGHGSMAGAKIPLQKALSKAGRAAVRRALHKRLLAAAGVGADVAARPFAQSPAEPEKAA